VLHESVSWLYAVLSAPEALAERRALLNPSDAHTTTARVGNALLWLPLGVALAGVIGRS
jgi:hypothetical protein